MNSIQESGMSQLIRRGAALAVPLAVVGSMIPDAVGATSTPPINTSQPDSGHNLVIPRPDNTKPFNPQTEWQIQKDPTVQSLSSQLEALRAITDTAIGPVLMTDEERKKSPKMIIRDAKVRTDSNGRIVERVWLTADGFLESMVLDPQTGKYNPYERLNQTGLALGTSEAIPGRPASVLALSADGSRIAVLGEDPANAYNTKVYFYTRGGVHALEELSQSVGGIYTEAVQVGDTQYLAMRENNIQGNTNIDLVDLKAKSVTPIQNAGFAWANLTAFVSPDKKTIWYAASEYKGIIEGEIDIASKTAKTTQKFVDWGWVHEGLFVERDSQGIPKTMYAINENAGILFKRDMQTDQVDEIWYKEFLGTTLPAGVLKVGDTLIFGGMGGQKEDELGAALAFWDETRDPKTDPNAVQILLTGAPETFIKRQYDMSSALYDDVFGLQANIHTSYGVNGSEEVLVRIDMDGALVDKTLYYPNKQAPPKVQQPSRVYMPIVMKGKG